MKKKRGRQDFNNLHDYTSKMLRIEIFIRLPLSDNKLNTLSLINKILK